LKNQQAGSLLYLFRGVIMKRILMIGLCLLVTSTASAQNWPSFRGQFASGRAEGKKTPVSWDVEKSINILWKIPIPGIAHSSPVVWGSRVFITTAVSSDPKPYFRHGLYGDTDTANDLIKHAWKVYCLDKLTGKTLWERTSHEGIPKIKRHIKSTHANSTPATDGKYVVAFFGSEGLYCYDFKGNLMWKADLGVLDTGWFYDPDYQWGTASSPIIYRNLVIVQCDIQKNSFVAAYDLNTGKRVWKTDRDEIPSWGTPTIYEGKSRVELVTNATRAIRSYDPMTGKLLWSMTGNPEVTATTPIAGNDLIYIVNHYRPNQPIYAIKPGATGDISLAKGETKNQFVAWSYQQGGAYMPTPLIYGDLLYVCPNNGALRVFNAATGERVYQERIGGTGGAYSGSPVAADGKIYFPSEDGEIYVVRAGAKYELLAINKMGEVLMTTPAISDGIIFVRGLNHLFAIAEKNGAKMVVSK
jgi:outer membrane protein assembly factor BamB